MGGVRAAAGQLGPPNAPPHAGLTTHQPCPEQALDTIPNGRLQVVNTAYMLSIHGQ